MKKIIFLLLAAISATAASAQTDAAYFMEGSTFRSQLNPALAPRQGYFNIPGLGGIQTTMTSNVGMGDIFFPLDGRVVSLFNKDISPQRALAGLHDHNRFALDQRVQILGFGAYTKNRRSFWSFDLGLRTEAEVSMPYSFFEFMKTAPEQASIRDLSVRMQAIAEVGFSYSWRVTDKIYVGARGKFLAGGFRARVGFDRLDVSLLEDAWTIDGTGSMDVYGFQPDAQVREDGSEYYELEDMFDFSNVRLPAAYGFGIDVGVTWDVLPDLQLSLSAVDLGMISWRKSANGHGRLTRQLGFGGVEIVDGVVVENDDNNFDLEKIEFDKVEARREMKSLKSSFYLGGEYKLFQRKLGLGLLYNMRLWENKTYHNLTASVNYTPIEWFTLGANYSFFNGRGNSLGLAINVCPSWINFYVATDLLLAKHTPQWIPIKSTSFNVTVGLGIPIGKRGMRRHPEDEPIGHGISPEVIEMMREERPPLLIEADPEVIEVYDEAGNLIEVEDAPVVAEVEVKEVPEVYLVEIPE